MKTKEDIVNVFLVDDDSVQLELMKHHLNEEFKGKIHIRKFKSITECLPQLRRKPEIVLLDYYLDTTPSHGPTGIELLKEIKKFAPETFVIIVSGQSQLEVAANAIKYGAFEYIAKNKSEFDKIRRTVSIAINQIYEARKLKHFKLIVIGIAAAIILAYVIKQILSSS